MAEVPCPTSTSTRWSTRTACTWQRAVRVEHLAAVHDALAAEPEAEAAAEARSELSAAG